MPTSPPSPPSRKLHFISGLPRAGSTVLAAILRQNPRFHTGVASPLGDVVNAITAEMSGKNDFAMAVDDAQRSAVLRGVFAGFYAHLRGPGVVFDSSRIWCSQLPLLATLLPDAKVIACVRELPWVLDSIERIVGRHPLRANQIFHFEADGTVYSRIEGLANAAGMVGFAYQATKDAWYGEYAPGRMLVLTYAGLVRNPHAALAAIYGFIGEPPFEHDFEHLDYRSDAFDARLGLPGLHAIRAKLAATQRESVLPPDLFQRFAKDSFWLDPATNLRKLQVI